MDTISEENHTLLNDKNKQQQIFAKTDLKPSPLPTNENKLQNNENRGKKENFF